MRLSSCGQVWKRGAKKRKLQKDEHASARVEAGISHRPTPLGVGAPRAKLQANGAQGLPPKRIERGVCSMVKCPARVLGSARVASCRPELPPPLGTPTTATPTALGACELAAFKRVSLGLQNCTSRSGDTEQSNHPATGSPRVALPRDRTSGSPVVT